jgi:hypothetical protein
VLWLRFTDRSTKKGIRSATVLLLSEVVPRLKSKRIEDEALDAIVAGPKQFLENLHGILQTDAYQAYAMVGGRGMVHAGAGRTARRGFANVVKLNPGDPVARGPGKRRIRYGTDRC